MDYDLDADQAEDTYVCNECHSNFDDPDQWERHELSCHRQTAAGLQSLEAKTQIHAKRRNSVKRKTWYACQACNKNFKPRNDPKKCPRCSRRRTWYPKKKNTL